MTSIAAFQPVEGPGSMMKLSEGCSLRGTVFNLVNSMMGAGILGLPFVFAETGVVLNLFLLVFVAALSDLTVWMLIYCLDATRETTYAGVAEVLYGRGLGLLIDFIIFSNNMGTMISYVIIIGDLMPSFLVYVDMPLIPLDRTHIVLMMFFPLLMVSSLKNLDALRHVSLVCILMILVFVASLVAMGTGFVPTVEITDQPIKLWTGDFAGVMRQLPVMVFAFRCQQNVPIFYTELRRQKSCAIDSKFATKRAKMMMASHLSTFTAGALYVIAAVCGCSAFRQRTASDVLMNFDRSIFAPAEYVRGCYVMVIICSYPVMAFSAVLSLHRLMSHTVELWSDTLSAQQVSADEAYMKLEGANTTPDIVRRQSDLYGGDYTLPGETHLQAPRTYEPAQRKTVAAPENLTRFCEVLGMVGFTVGAGLLIPDITLVFGLTGGVCASTVMYVFPSMMYIKVKREEPAESSRMESTVILAYFVFLFGVVVCVGSTGLIACKTFFGRA